MYIPGRIKLIYDYTKPRGQRTSVMDADKNIPLLKIKSIYIDFNAMDVTAEVVYYVERIGQIRTQAITYSEEDIDLVVIAKRSGNEAASTKR